MISFVGSAQEGVSHTNNSMSSSNPPATSRAVVPPKGKCINGKHRQPCWSCKLPSASAKDGLCHLVDSQPGGLAGAEVLKRQIEQSPEWNSEEARAQLRQKYKARSQAGAATSTAAETSDSSQAKYKNLCEGLGGKDLSRLTKVDLLQLCRDWEFRSDIWHYKVVKPALHGKLSRNLRDPRRSHPHQTLGGGGFAEMTTTTTTLGGTTVGTSAASVGVATSQPSTSEGAQTTTTNSPASLGVSVGVTVSGGSGGLGLTSGGPDLGRSLSRSDSMSCSRCIDPSHSQPCQICLAAPEEEEEYRFQLVGDPGRKNGEKKLRKFIQMTKEWNSPAARAKVADSFAHRPDLSTFRKVVANKEAANLRKPHLIRLCREWNFRSNIWQTKKVKYAKKASDKSETSSLGIKRETPLGMMQQQQQQHHHHHQQQQQQSPVLSPLAGTLEWQALSQQQAAGAGPGAAVPGKDRIVGLLSEANDYLSKVAKELQQLAPLHWGGPAAEATILSMTGTAFSSVDLAKVFNSSRVLLASTRESLHRFAATVESSILTFGSEQINVISLISSAQTLTLSKMKLEATKAELMRVRSQMTPQQKANVAWFELQEVVSAGTILAESENQMLQILAAVPKLFPSHLGKQLTAVIMGGLSLYTVCQSVSAMCRFTGYSVYLESLICIFGLFVEFEDQLLTLLNHLVGVILTQMISNSSVSPPVQSTLQQLLLGNFSSSLPTLPTLGVNQTPALGSVLSPLGGAGASVSVSAGTLSLVSGGAAATATATAPAAGVALREEDLDEEARKLLKGKGQQQR